jgi:hypothetical protein
MSEQQQSAWRRLMKAVKEAKDILAADHYNVIVNHWDDPEVMQTFENIECALMDIQDKEPPLLAAAKWAMENYNSYLGCGEEPCRFIPSMETLRQAIKNYEGQ